MQKLYNKYKVRKTSGEPIDPKALYFVLRIDTDPAARVAMLTYADEMEKSGEGEFAGEIRGSVSILRAAGLGVAGLGPGRQTDGSSSRKALQSSAPERAEGEL